MNQKFTLLLMVLVCTSASCQARGGGGRGGYMQPMQQMQPMYQQRVGIGPMNPGFYQYTDDRYMQNGLVGVY